MKKKTSYLIVGIIVVVGLVVDLITKVVFANVLHHGETEIELIPNLLKFIYIENDGAAYGMLGGHTWLLIVLSIVFVIGFICYYIFNHSTSLWYSFGIGLIVSGAIGNLIDRIFIGRVRDFISIDFFNFICNVADIWITIGVVCFAIHIINEIIKETKEKKGNGAKIEKDDTTNK